jgi:hypothetical protein
MLIGKKLYYKYNEGFRAFIVVSYGSPTVGSILRGAPGLKADFQVSDEMLKAGRINGTGHMDHYDVVTCSVPEGVTEEQLTSLGYRETRQFNW